LPTLKWIPWSTNQDSKARSCITLKKNITYSVRKNLSIMPTSFIHQSFWFLWAILGFPFSQILSSFDSKLVLKLYSKKKEQGPKNCFVSLSLSFSLNLMQ
jgi:hypothetical protein